MEQHDIVIIGAGPAGLSLAWELAKRGAKDVVVLEREAEAGGIPRHCGHAGFGAFSTRSLQTGPQLAQYLRQGTSNLDIRTSATALEFTMRGDLRVQTVKGISEMSASRIILATGTRETPRAARLIGGNKLRGVMNTGEFQQRVYLHSERPFQHPVIIGAEWVSFSSLLTCRHAGIKPVAMFTENPRPEAPAYFALGARWFFGVPVKSQTKVLAIHGQSEVEAVEVERHGKRQVVACDGVIVSGKFRSESALYGAGYLATEGYAPKVTGRFQTSRPGIYAVGNVLGHLDTASACLQQGRDLAAILQP